MQYNIATHPDFLFWRYISYLLAYLLVSSCLNPVTSTGRTSGVPVEIWSYWISFAIREDAVDHSRWRKEIKDGL